MVKIRRNQDCGLLGVKRDVGQRDRHLGPAAPQLWPKGARAVNAALHKAAAVCTVVHEKRPKAAVQGVIETALMAFIRRISRADVPGA